jgi:hypothetical protein
MENDDDAAAAAMSGGEATQRANPACPAFLARALSACIPAIDIGACVVNMGKCLSDDDEVRSDDEAG